MDAKQNNSLPLKVLRPKVAAAKLGISRPTFYRYTALPGFPSRVPLGPRAVGYFEHELDQWLVSRAAQAVQS
jgi:prophage regulatory protein